MFLYLFSLAAPKSRPVTANRRKVEDFSVTSSVMSDDLASAIEEENRRLNEYKGNTCFFVFVVDLNNFASTILRDQKL